MRGILRGAIRPGGRSELIALNQFLLMRVARTEIGAEKWTQKLKFRFDVNRTYFVKAAS